MPLISSKFPWCLIMWSNICFISVWITCTACHHEKSPCSSNGLCLNQRRSPLSSMRKVPLRPKKNQSPTREMSGVNTSLGALEKHKPHRVTANSSTHLLKKLAVDALAHDIVEALMLKEILIGTHVKQHIDSVAEGLSKFNDLVKKCVYRTPTTQEFIENVSLTLDALKIGSEIIADDLVRVQALELNPSNKMIGVIRLHYNFKHIQRYKNLRNFRKRGKILGEKTTNPTFPARQSVVGEFCDENSSINRTWHKCYSKVEDWWRPIIRVRDELKNSVLWMLFLEELSYKTESVEIILDPTQIKLIEWFKENMLSTENLAEALSLISKDLNLFSVSRKIPQLVETVNESRLKFLNDILKLSLLSKTSCFRVGNTTYVEAPYVFMSDVLNCSRMFTKQNSSINVVSVISSAKFLMDQDFLVDNVRSLELEHGQGFHLILISPEWMVLGKKESGSKKYISLNGRKPPSYPPAMDNSDGKPGLPGEEGGRFYAIGRFLSGGSIFVDLNGGQGGSGQDGGTSKLITMTCYESQASACTEYFCCYGPSTKFVFPGRDGGRTGNGANPGQYELFVFTPMDRKKIEFQQIAGVHGEAGLGKKYSILKEGLYPDAELLTANNYKRFENYTGPRWCHDMRNDSQHVYLPLSEKDEDRFTGKDNVTGTPRTANEITFGPKKIIPVIRRYRSLARNYFHLFNIHKIQNFITNIDWSTAIQSLYGTDDLVNEFNDLAERTQLGNFYREILKVSYHSLSVRANARTVNYTGNKNADHLKILDILSLASRGRLLAIANPFEPLLTVDINKLLAIEKRRILEIKFELQRQSSLELITQAVFSYNSIIASRFSELASFINNTIYLQTDFLEIELCKNLQVLLDKIKELIKDEKNNIQTLKESRRKLKDHRIANIVAIFFKTISEVVTIIWSIGATLSLGVDLTNVFSTCHRVNCSLTSNDIPEALAMGSSIAAFRFRRSSHSSLEGFKRQLKTVLLKLSEFSEAFPQSLDTINYTQNLPIFENIDDLTTPLDKFPPKDCVLSYDRLLTTETIIRRLQIKVSIAIHADVSDAISVGISGSEIHTIRSVSKVAVAILKENCGIFNKLKVDRVLTEEISKAIEGTHREVRSVESHIFKMQRNIITELRILMNVLSQELPGQQSFAIMTLINKMQAAIRDIRLDMKHKTLGGSPLEAYFVRSIQSLRDAAGILIGLIEKLDTYRDMAKLEKAIKIINLHPKLNYENLNNASLQKIMMELIFTIQGDILVKRQSLVEGAFRVWKFPIVNPILCSFENLSTMSQNFSTREHVRQYAQNIENRIDHMIHTVNKSKINIVDGDKYILQVNFFRSNGLQFYKWENSSWWPFIESLFDGQSTFLYSNHFPGPNICEVVKFRQIFLSFGSAQEDIDLEANLKAVLNDYLVSLTHEGRSYYLFANQTFVISNEKLEFIFSFEVNSDGLPVTRNIVYDKILLGDITLSPYSMWSISLKPLKPSIGFERLSKFSKKVDMYLEGVGSCVSKKFAVEGNYASPTCEDVQKI